MGEGGSEACGDLVEPAEGVACMSRIVNSAEGEAVPASENGPDGSSEEAGGAWGLRRRGAAATLGRSRQDVPSASYARNNKADRPVRYPRLRPRTGARVAALCLVKLEPLTES